jgi:hypothetical protein
MIVYRNGKEKKMSAADATVELGDILAGDGEDYAAFELDSSKDIQLTRFGKNQNFVVVSSSDPTYEAFNLSKQASLSGVDKFMSITGSEVVLDDAIIVDDATAREAINCFIRDGSISEEMHWHRDD